MTDDLGGRLAAQGIEVPELEPLPLAAGVTTVGFLSGGDEALAWWRRLRVVHERTRYWPALIPPADEILRPSGAVEAEPAERLARAVSLNGAELLNPKGTFESLED